MPFEPRPGQGALFRNDKKAKESQPDATGYILAHRDIRAGEKIRLAAWTKRGSHQAFQSLMASDWKESRQDPQAPLDDDGLLDDKQEIPF